MSIGNQISFSSLKYIISDVGAQFSGIPENLIMNMRNAVEWKVTSGMYPNHFLALLLDLQKLTFWKMPKIFGYWKDTFWKVPN